MQRLDLHVSEHITTPFWHFGVGGLHVCGMIFVGHIVIHCFYHKNFPFSWKRKMHVQLQFQKLSVRKTVGLKFSQRNFVGLIIKNALSKFDTYMHQKTLGLTFSTKKIGLL